MSIVIPLNIKKQRTAKENIKQNIKNNTRARKFLVKHQFLLRIQTLLILLIRFRRLSNLYINHFFKSYFLTYYLLLLLLLILLLPCCFCSLHILLLTRKFWLYFFTNKLAYIHLKINILIFSTLSSNIPENICILRCTDYIYEFYFVNEMIYDFVLIEKKYII